MPIVIEMIPNFYRNPTSHPEVMRPAYKVSLESNPLIWEISDNQKESIRLMEIRLGIMK